MFRARRLLYHSTRLDGNIEEEESGVVSEVWVVNPVWQTRRERSWVSFAIFSHHGTCFERFCTDFPVRAISALGVTEC